MAGYSARQSSFTTGDTILAAHSNDEFNQVLAAFHATTGHSHDGTAGEGGPISTLRDADSNNKILVDSTNNHLEFYVEVSSSAVEQIKIQDGAIVPVTDNDIDLGTSSLEFKDLFIDGTANVDAINLDGTLITSTAAELNILDGVTSTAAELNILDGVTATAAELNLVDGITAGTVSASKAVIVDSNKDLTGLRNLTISGDLTVSGDDITMGTNTDTAIMVADGTNFNPVVPSGDVTLTNAGVFGIASGVIVNADINASAAIADSKLDTISTAGKVDIGALEIDGATDIGADLADADLLIVDDGANGTERKTAMSRVQTYIEGKISGDITISSGTAAIGAGVIVNADINSSAAIADSKLDTISTANKVGLAALDIDGGTDIGADIVDADLFIIDDGAGGTNRKVAASRIKTYTNAGVSSAADDITLGDAAVTIATSSGDITIDAQASDSDIIFKGTDGGVDTTFLTIDGSDAGTASFNHDIKLSDNSKAVFGAGDDLEIFHDGSTSNISDVGTGQLVLRTDGTQVAINKGSSENMAKFITDGAVELYHDNSKKFETTSSGVTITGALTTDAGGVSLAALDIDGATDIGADLVDADLFIVDDGAGGTNRKVAASRIKTYIGGGTQWQAVKTGNYTASAGEGVFMNTTSGALTLTLPASPSIGDEVTFIDYAGTFDSNNLTIARNSSKILGAEADLTVAVERAANTLVFTDSTQGWLFKTK